MGKMINVIWYIFVAAQYANVQLAFQTFLGHSVPGSNWTTTRKRLLVEISPLGRSTAHLGTLTLDVSVLFWDHSVHSCVLKSASNGNLLIGQYNED